MSSVHLARYYSDNVLRLLDDNNFYPSNLLEKACLRGNLCVARELLELGVDQFEDTLDRCLEEFIYNPAEITKEKIDILFLLQKYRTLSDFLEEGTSALIRRHIARAADGDFTAALKVLLLKSQNPKRLQDLARLTVRRHLRRDGNTSIHQAAAQLPLPVQVLTFLQTGELT